MLADPNLCMDEENSKKRPLKLDWNFVLDKNDDEPLQLLVVKRAGDPPKPSMITTDQSSRDDCLYMNNRELDDAIKRLKSNVIKLGPGLPDKGDKLRVLLKSYEEELNRRKLPRPEMDIDVCEKPSSRLRSFDVSDGFKRGNALSEAHPQSEFASSFSRKMEENTDCKIGNAFGKELSILGRCNRQKSRFNGNSSYRRRHKGYSSSRQLPCESVSSLSHNGEKHGTPKDDQEGRAASTSPFHYNEENLFHSLSKKKDSCQVLASNGSRPRKEQTIVLVDEDETWHVDTMEQENKLADCMKDAEINYPSSMKDTKIYYPSRDDPGSVEISHMDLNCLAPEGFLTSPIMNFYIRYLQAHTTNKAIFNYHFFSTFFYKKLKQALSYKGSNKESFFAKFRRWWKGVNIFQKAYVFIPIHEDLHWSLVIICIPDKEDESGLIILHLDSLGLHSSRSVFVDIRSFLKEEWNCMNQEVSSSDLPIADRIWELLPCRIDEKKIEVPQQKNDYDCGLFVLFFMERFIEEAPDRLRKKNLAMFGKRWFRPEQASRLRVKIRKLLLDEFQNASKSGCISSPRLQMVLIPEC